MELLSGPDLGGGYLFQLEVERSGDRARVTVHAQEGGLEAAVAPPASVRSLGFLPIAGGCPLGGRGCLHRRFDVPVATLARVRTTYNRARFVAAAALDQQAGTTDVPIAEGMRTLLDRLGTAPELVWFVGGDAAAWLHGVEGRPRSIVLGTDRPGVDGIAELLEEFLIEPAATTEWPDRPELYGARAFVGTLVRGVRVEWAAVPSGTLEWGLGGSSPRIRPVAWEGRSVRVAPLEFPAVRWARAAGRQEFGAAVARLLETGLDVALWEELASAEPTSVRERLGRATASLRASGRSLGS